MRPLASSSLPMVGMLFSTLAARRPDQNPARRVTARTGTLRSLACGEPARFRTPCSLQGGDAAPRSRPVPGGRVEKAAADATVVTNRRRGRRWGMAGTSPWTTPGILPLKRSAGAGRFSGVVDQAVVNGVKGQLQAVRYAQLIEDVVQVILDGLFGDEQLLADLLVAEALRHQLDDLLF